MGLLKHSKLTAGILTAAICAALLLAGTFAWVSFTKATNDFLGNGQVSGATLHDDHCGSKKEIYVENWGESTIYTRIKLFEYMELGEGAGRYKEDEDGARKQDPTNNAKSLLDGAKIFDQKTWAPHIPYGNEAKVCKTAADFHYYWDWNMGG